MSASVARLDDSGGGLPSRDAVRLLQVFAITAMIFPSDAVIRAIGANGYVASLVALVGFTAYWASVALGFHDPRTFRNPIRTAVALLWIVSLVSYAHANTIVRPESQVLSGDRWILQLMGVTGVVLLAGDLLRTLDDLRRVVRALVWGGAVCGVVALLQFKLSTDLSGHLRMLPGFTVNSEYGAIMSRGGLNRVAGTALHPIELGVVAGMVLPLAVYLAIHDKERRLRSRWLQVALVGVAVPASVSRSSTLASALSLGLLLLLLPPTRRVVGLVALPVVLAAVFLTVPGLMSTLGSFFGAGTSDPSVATRVDDYPFVESLVRQSPWIGQGAGTFAPADAFEILDNQYLKTAIELGLPGLVVLLMFMTFPVVAALASRRRFLDEESRTLATALAGAALSAAVCSAFFDSFSFPMFVSVHALVLGLTGALFVQSRGRPQDLILVATEPLDARSADPGTVPIPGGVPAQFLPLRTAPPDIAPDLHAVEHGSPGRTLVDLHRLSRRRGVRVHYKPLHRAPRQRRPQGES